MAEHLATAADSELRRDAEPPFVDRLNVDGRQIEPTRHPVFVTRKNYLKQSTTTLGGTS